VLNPLNIQMKGPGTVFEGKPNPLQGREFNGEVEEMLENDGAHRNPY